MEVSQGPPMDWEIDVSKDKFIFFIFQMCFSSHVLSIQLELTLAGYIHQILLLEDNMLHISILFQKVWNYENDTV